MSAVHEWLALLRVHEGGVTCQQGRYLNHGQPVADYLAVALEELVRTERLALGRPGCGGQRRVCVTRAGQVRYSELTTGGLQEPRDGG